MPDTEEQQDGQAAQVGQEAQAWVGGPPTDAHHLRETFKLARVAAKRWGIPDETRRAVVAHATVVAAGRMLMPDGTTKQFGEDGRPLISTRTRLAAMRLLATLDKIDADREAAEAGVGGVQFNFNQANIDLSSLSQAELESIVAIRRRLAGPS